MKNLAYFLLGSCGDVNTIKTHAARRVSIVILFQCGLSFFKEKYGMGYRPYERFGAILSGLVDKS